MRSNYYLQFFDDIIKGEFKPEKLLRLPKDQLLSRLLAHQTESGINIRNVTQVLIPKSPGGQLSILRRSTNIFPCPIKISLSSISTLSHNELMDTIGIEAIAEILNVRASILNIEEVKNFPNQFIVTFSYQPDLLSLEVGPLAYLYLNLSLKTQVDEIKENLRLCIFEEREEISSLKNFIVSHQELITHHIALFYRYMDTPTYYSRSSMPDNPSYQDFYTLAGMYCEKVQRFLEHHFNEYLDKNKPTNPRQIDRNLEQNKDQIAVIQESLKSGNDPLNVLNQLEKHFDELKYTPGKPFISYNRLEFLSNLINQLYEFFQVTSKSSNHDIAFIECLIDCNLNTTKIWNSITDYLESELALMNSAEHKIDYLRNFVKIFNQRSLLQFNRYNSQFPDLAELLNNWCNLTITYWKESPLFISENNNLSGALPLRKIKVKAKVMELAAWFKILADHNIINHKDMPIVFRYLSNVIIPEELEELKTSSLSTRYREPIRLKTKRDITDLLARFQGYLRSR